MRSYPCVSKARTNQIVDGASICKHMVSVMSKPKIDQDTILAIMRVMLAEISPGKSLLPTDVAWRAGGEPTRTPEWRPLLRTVGRVAAMLQDSGELTALRKGKPVDIRKAKGIIRFTVPVKPEGEVGEPPVSEAVSVVTDTP
jgi:hypothetical protein